MNILLLAAILLLNIQTETFETHKPLAGKVIVVDPGHGGTAETDSFRVGPSGEREEWNKTGTLAYFRGDSAVIFAEETYFVSIFVKTTLLLRKLRNSLRR